MKSKTNIVFSLIVVLSASACVPRNMHVEAGLDPRHVNSDVRFRTTYYFRTFDYCWDANGDTGLSGKAATVSYQDIIPETDTLYRYRVTGKANAIFSNIRFESGVLNKNQIDPFGKSVLFDKQSSQFTVAPAGTPAPGAISAGSRLSPPINGDNNTVNIITKESEDPAREAGQCKIGNVVKKGFQIMGPEGIRTFNQDERLVIAMSSSADPLIEQMQKYSGRILNAEDNVLQQLVALANEDSKISQARAEISDQRRATIGDQNKFYCGLIAQLGGETTKVCEGEKE